jgi:hypothetical protein
VGGSRHKEMVNESVYGGFIFVAIYESRRMKHVEIFLRMGYMGNVSGEYPSKC